MDFDALQVTDDIGAICVSRPTNPTGNVLTDAEVRHLGRLAREHDIPLIVDNAYGAPFPSILYADVQPEWDEHTILCMSLSKLGMPGPRTGIVIAAPRIARAVAALCLAACGLLATWGWQSYHRVESALYGTALGLSLIHI